MYDFTENSDWLLSFLLNEPIMGSSHQWSSYDSAGIYHSIGEMMREKTLLVYRALFVMHCLDLYFCVLEWLNMQQPEHNHIVFKFS